MAALLELQHLKKYYATQKAVDDVSFTIEKGSIFGLLGPNGAGKTTLLRMITGIFFPDEGSIQFDGKPFNALADVINIGYMPEERGLYKKMKIGEQAIYLAELKGLSHKDASARVKHWFEKLEMQSWWNKKVEDLSKGMQQKLQFVTTVLHEPKLIILDEPFSGLDPVNAKLIKDEILQLSKEGRTIIFSTHRMGEVEEICDKIVLINKGRKILDGTVAGIKNEYRQHKFEITVNGPLNAPMLATPLFNVISSTATRLVLTKDPETNNNELIEYFIRRDMQIHEFREILPSLNEIFIRLVDHSGAVTRSFSEVPAT